MYASGSATLGGYFPGVDTFLGLQIAAVRIMDDLASKGFVKKIGPLRSSSPVVEVGAPQAPPQVTAAPTAAVPSPPHRALREARR